MHVQITKQYQCARLTGLDSCDGLMLLGSTHFYVIEGITITGMGEVIDIESAATGYVCVCYRVRMCVSQQLQGTRVHVLWRKGLSPLLSHLPSPLPSSPLPSPFLPSPPPLSSPLLSSPSLLSPLPFTFPPSTHFSPPHRSYEPVVPGNIHAQSENRGKSKAHIPIQ